MANILLCEDDEDLRNLITQYLNFTDHTVEPASTGSEGLTKLQQHAYDLAILDWGLPGMTGLEVCREFRAGGGLVPILMLTGMDKPDQKEQAMAAGANDYLVKPFKIKELSTHVQALLLRSTTTA